MSVILNEHYRTKKQKPSSVHSICCTEHVVFEKYWVINTVYRRVIANISLWQQLREVSKCGVQNRK